VTIVEMTSGVSSEPAHFNLVVPSAQPTTNAGCCSTAPPCPRCPDIAAVAGFEYLASHRTKLFRKTRRPLPDVKWLGFP
jgi:hypothetical protein